jgi:hypothetical protein
MNANLHTGYLGNGKRQGRSRVIALAEVKQMNAF